MQPSPPSFYFHTPHTHTHTPVLSLLYFCPTNRNKKTITQPLNGYITPFFPFSYNNTSKDMQTSSGPTNSSGPFTTSAEDLATRTLKFEDREEKGWIMLHFIFREEREKNQNKRKNKKEPFFGPFMMPVFLGLAPFFL